MQHQQLIKEWVFIRFAWWNKFKTSRNKIDFKGQCEEKNYKYHVTVIKMYSWSKIGYEYATDIKSCIDKCNEIISYQTWYKWEEIKRISLLNNTIKLNACVLWHFIHDKLVFSLSSDSSDCARNIMKDFWFLLKTWNVENTLKVLVRSSGNVIHKAVGYSKTQIHC